MLHRYIIAVPAKINTQHMKPLCMQMQHFFNVKNPGDTWSNRWVLKCSLGYAIREWSERHDFQFRIKTVSKQH